MTSFGPKNVTSLTWGPNWPLRCLDCLILLQIVWSQCQQINIANRAKANIVNIFNIVNIGSQEISKVLKRSRGILNVPSIWTNFCACSFANFVVYGICHVTHEDDFLAERDLLWKDRNPMEYSPLEAASSPHSALPLSPFEQLTSCLFFIHQGGRSCAGARGPPPKSLDSDENSKPKHTLFCRKLRFVAIYALFGDLWAKKAFWVKNSVSCARNALWHGMYCIWYWVKFAIMHKTTHLSRKK